MRILIDTDPGLGKKSADIDDALALFLILNNPEIFEVEGITTVFGNTPVKTGYKLLQEYLELVEKEDIPHRLGAKSKKELGQVNEASQLLIEKVKNNPDELILLTLGPLTNIATAYLHYPSFFDDLKKIVFMGGTINPTEAFSERFQIIEDFFKTEFNFYQDAEATKILIEKPTMTPRIGMGLDICCKTIFKQHHLKRIEQSEKPIPNFILDDLKYWLNLWQYNKSKGFYPFDCFVPIYLMHPEMFNFINISLKVDTEEIPGRLIKINDNPAQKDSIRYCMDFKKEEYAEKFVQILIDNLIE
ncbi:MAG: hypothetical protein GF329_14930 [Candidatus Lokiarchaeota archaeon]|nr:hypothetical protein [Candidatus Lokiarchaeota archaeon]